MGYTHQAASQICPPVHKAFLDSSCLQVTSDALLQSNFSLMDKTLAKMAPRTSELDCTPQVMHGPWLASVAAIVATACSAASTVAAAASAASALAFFSAYW
eukprot:CAMPEP_0172865694 /NCGR_PEP_ID=MMETSP1075-20121228/81559_1 /TAXON_ID=2916 /ORGANISM="Ceratium fusus, Strain PA161109" /LENGTH=100 /DNA_ID=CAMNT_0013714771 /DNA_START=623 /DNA_END=922 /DNA_ORIENTATION=-